jgi:hypothetical protein
LVKGNIDNDEMEEDLAPTVLHGTQVLLQLTTPWFNSNRIVCADSYFASVGAAQEMIRNGLRFIGVVKTATRRYPKAHLSRIEFTQRGEFQGVVGIDGNNTGMYAFVWMDRDRRYFISTTGNMEHGLPYTRKRWRRVDDADNAEPELVDLTIPQPKTAEVYYSTCAAIDRHNRCRQHDLAIEKKIKVKSWYKRVNVSIFGICIVDTWLVYNGCRQQESETQKEFYSFLAEELIDNTYDNIHRRARAGVSTTPQNLSLLAGNNGNSRSGISAHLTPTKRLKRDHEGHVINHRWQARCKTCSMKTTKLCSVCYDNNETVPICDPCTGKSCFSEHMQCVHDN